MTALLEQDPSKVRQHQALLRIEPPHNPLAPPVFVTQDAAAPAAEVAPGLTSLARLLTSHILRDGELVLLILRPSLWFIAIQSALFIGVVALLAALLARADRHL